MRPITFALILMAISPVMAFQSDLIIPWVTNNSQFGSTIAINNQTGTAATVTLEAKRSDGSSDSTTRDIPALGQLVEDVNTLFPNLGTGSGYAVHITSSTANISGGFIVTGTGSPSGSSPAQANVVRTDTATTIQIFNLLSASSNGDTSAVAVVNTGNNEADIVFHAYQDGAEVGTFTMEGIEPFQPGANVVSSMFPELVGNLFLVAESNEPFSGMAFIFNSDLEPSMANSAAAEAVPGEDDGGNNGGGEITVSFSQDVAPILSTNCATPACHSAPGQEGLVLSSSVAYEQIVNVRASQASLDRVEPGNPEDSYLYRKLLPSSEASYSGSRMPRGRAPLSSSNLQLIETWIREGANDN